MDQVARRPKNVNQRVAASWLMPISVDRYSTRSSLSRKLVALIGSADAFDLKGTEIRDHATAGGVIAARRLVVDEAHSEHRMSASRRLCGCIIDLSDLPIEIFG